MTECTRCRRQYQEGVRFCPVDGFAAVPVSDPYVGRLLLGQFQLLAACGRGATGTVYRAQQVAMDRLVAVKILRPDLLQDEAVVKRFIREARAGARLCHPNIATVHLVGQTDEGVPYIVMEYIEGTPLSAVLAAEAPLPPGRALHIAEQIASALGEAHDHNIVHRDLKPENILLTERRGDRDIVKVVDFGIAKIVADNVATDSQISRIGTIFGTPHYIAPEQASGAEVDARADLYSLGCILFQMSTGRVPFEGTSGIQVLLRHLREEPPDPRALNPRLPESLAALVLGLLVKDREGRTASAEVVLASIQGVREVLHALPAEVHAPLSTAEHAYALAAAVPAAASAPTVPVPVAKRSGDQAAVAPPAAEPAAAPAAEPLPIDDDPDEELRAVLPWWRRRSGVLLGSAALLGLILGCAVAWRSHPLHWDLSGGAAKSEGAAVARGGGAVTPMPAPPAPPPPARPSAPTASAGPAQQHAGRAAPAHPAPVHHAPPAPAVVHHKGEGEHLPEVRFPPSPVAAPPTEVPALPAAAPPPVIAAPVPTPAEAQPAAPPPPVVASPPPAPPPPVIEPPAPPPPAPAPARGDEDEDPSKDPYHMLK